MPETHTRLKDPKMTYQNLAFMSYVVPTFYPTPPGAPAATNGAPTVVLADPDLQARAQRFLNVLFWTKEQLASKSWMKDEKTLKVFQAPEFYFRHASKAEVQSERFAFRSFYGSYPEQAPWQLAEQLYSAIQKEPGFRDWTIVAGTICSVLNDRIVHDDEQFDLRNTAIVLRGQRAAMDDAVPYALMEKHYISHIDGPPQEWHVNLNPTSVFSFRLNPDQSLDNIINWDEMLFGLEVCLDHAKGVLDDALIRLSSVFGASTPRLDLQTVTSCGMSIVLQHVAVKEGGLVLLTDGMSHQREHYPTPATRMGRYLRHDNLVLVRDIALPNLAVLPNGDNYNVDYPHYAGQQGIYAFEPQAILDP